MTLLANIAVPLYFPQPVLALAALIPVIMIETVSLKRQARVSWRDVSSANVLTTLLGIPLAFLCLAILGAGFGVFLDKYYTNWPVLILVLSAVTIPCFALSIIVEGYFLRSRVGGLAGRSFWFAVTKAHCYSYLALLVIYCSWISIKISG